MKISRELKIGALTIIVAASMFWGYKFVIGQNLLKASRTFYVNYSDVTNLAVSSPVMLNGFPLGVVTDIKLNTDNVNQMLVKLSIENVDIGFPKSTVAVLASEGLVGGKYIRLEFDALCDGSNCAESGYVFEGRQQGLLGSLMGENEMDSTISSVSEGLVDVISSIGKEDSEGAVNEAFRNLAEITKNLADLTSTTNNLMSRSQRNLEATIENISVITETIAGDRDRISGLIENLDSITSSVAKADLGKTIENSNEAIVQTTDAIKEFQKTLEITEETMTKLSDILSKVEAGEGSLAQLINDEQLYVNLEFTSRNLALLLQDFRLNPRRYVSLSVFGKKAPEYVNPDEDPALKDEFQIKKIKKDGGGNNDE